MWLTWAMTTSAAAMSSSPAAHIRRAPNLAASAGARRAVGSMVAAMGSMLTAAMRAESPRTICRYCRNKKMKP